MFSVSMLACTRDTFYLIWSTCFLYQYSVQAMQDTLP
jgi:hypothetical protein